MEFIKKTFLRKKNEEVLISEDDQFFSELLINDGNYFNFRHYPYYPEIKSKKPLPSSFLLAASIKGVDFKDDVKRDVEFILKNKNTIPICFTVTNKGGEFSMEYYLFSPKDDVNKEGIEIFKPILKYFKPAINFEKIRVKDDYYLISINPRNQNIEEFNYFLINNNGPVESYYVDSMGYQVNKEEFIEEGYRYDLNTHDIISANMYYIYVYSDKIGDLLDKIQALTREVFPNENPKRALDFLKLPYFHSSTLHFKGSSLPVGVAKKKNAIGLYFRGLEISTFIHFLRYHDYPLALIQEIEKNRLDLEHLLFDFKVDFYLKNDEFYIKKTAFFGQF